MKITRRAKFIHGKHPLTGKLVELPIKGRKSGNRKINSAYQAAWVEQEKQWEKLRKWKRKMSPTTKLPKRTHLMDFAAGWSAAIRAAYESVGRLSG